MNNLQKSAILFSVACVLLSAFCPVEAKTGFDLAVVGSGARPMGMGGAFTAVADDLNALFSNPAGLGQQKNWGMTSMSTQMMDRVDYKMVGGIYPTDFGTFGVGYIAALTPAGFATTDKNSLAGASATPLSYGTSQFSLSYGLNLGDLVRISGVSPDMALGATYRATSSVFGGVDGSGSGRGLDVGLIFWPLPNLSGGLTLQNIGGGVDWNNGSKEELPLVTKVGGAYDLGRARLALDVENSAGVSLLHGGAEYRPTANIALRAGVEQAPAGAGASAVDLTAGVGFKFAGFSFDYAYRQDGGLADNSNHYFSLSFQPETRSPVAAAQPKGPNVSQTPAAARIDGLYRSRAAIN
ncbi:MAG TPA: hypothetical protein VMT55_05520 [Candidatus Sulfotelmatobacter sp.]|nr:hypothetical protein [Candidatus Sulfotelmatobacter sp.]